MLRSKIALTFFLTTAALVTGLPAHSQQRMMSTTAPTTAAPAPPRPEPARNTTQPNRTAPQQNMSFNPTEQQKMEQAGKNRAAREMARDVKATQASTKGVQAKKKEDQLDKSADAESKKLGMKQKVCEQQCSKKTGYKPSVSYSEGAYGSGASLSFGNTTKSALYITCVKNNCQ